MVSRLGVRAEPLFRCETLLRAPDVSARSVLIEVKTWDAASWEAWGRCLSAYQLESVLYEAALIVLCRVHDRDRTIPC